MGEERDLKSGGGEGESKEEGDCEERRHGWEIDSHQTSINSGSTYTSWHLSTSYGGGFIDFDLWLLIRKRGQDCVCWCVCVCALSLNELKAVSDSRREIRIWLLLVTDLSFFIISSFFFLNVSLSKSLGLCPLLASQCIFHEESSSNS